ncbi:hypothetical protein ACP70R_036533 [Stipagrostis hirtigluma subsp. patula]
MEMLPLPASAVSARRRRAGAPIRRAGRRATGGDQRRSRVRRHPRDRGGRCPRGARGRGSVGGGVRGAGGGEARAGEVVSEEGSGGRGGVLLIPKSCCYALNQGKIHGASLGDEVGLTYYKIMNGSHNFQRSNDKGATQLDDDNSISNYIAEHVMDSLSCYGVIATSDVYGFQVDPDARSGIFVQIANLGDGARSSENGINVGWHVFPGLYGDSKTHFYVRWTRDGYQETGCYNLDCPGYVPEANIPIVPGATIDAVSDPDGVRRLIIFKVFKDSAGDWLLHVGFDSEPYLIGRFPKSLFTSLGDKANSISLAGFVATRTTHLAPMGSGFLPNNTKAASFSNIQVIDQNGEASKVQQDQPVVIDDMNLYSVSPISFEGKFTYGGPLE